MGIPFGAVVVDMSSQAARGRQSVTRVTYFPRHADGCYGEQCTAAIRSLDEQRLIREALDTGQAAFWGGWFGDHGPVEGGDAGPSDPGDYLLD